MCGILTCGEQNGIPYIAGDGAGAYPFTQKLRVFTRQIFIPDPQTWIVADETGQHRIFRYRKRDSVLRKQSGYGQGGEHCSIHAARQREQRKRRERTFCTVHAEMRDGKEEVVYGYGFCMEK